MKKVIALMLAIVVSLLLCACNSKNKDFVPAEDALPAVPELVGEWGSIYFAEESLMTICEDGTCTVLRQPGTWGLHKDFLMWPKVLIIGQLDNKTEVNIDFSMHTKYGYSYACMDVYNKKNETLMYSIAEVVNRSEVPSPVEAVPFVVGAWIDGENTEPFATFHEDGTCEILGADGLWGLNYPAYYNEDFLSGWDYRLKAKIGEEEWDISISEEENGRYGFSILNPQGGMSVVQTQEARNANHTYFAETTDTSAETEPKSEVVEITLDNWQEYFEFVENVSWSKNAFGEVEGLLGVGVNLQLKEEYQQRFVSIENGAIETQYQAAVVGCEINMDEETYKLLDTYKISDNVFTKMNTLSTSVSMGSGEYREEAPENAVLQDMLAAAYGVSGPYANSVHGYPVNIEITRIQGTLTLYAE